MKRSFRFNITCNLFLGIMLFLLLNFAYADTVNVEQITLDNRAITLSVGKTANVKAILAPKNATNKSIEWSSLDESVATVAKGKVTIALDDRPEAEQE